MRVGRAALDEEAIRLIEEYNPDVEFDWTRILKGQELEPTATRDRPHRADRAARRRPAPRPSSPFAAPRSGSDLDFSSPEDRDLTPEQPPSGSDLDFAGSEDRDLTPELEEATAPADEAAPAELQRPTQSRLGSEGLARLRARYAEVLARISERVPDPGRQEELKTQAERLNPDTWVTDAEVSAGLEGYETTFDALRNAIGGPSRRRRRKKRRGSARQGSPPTEGASDETGPDVPADGGGGEDDRSEDI